MFAGQPVLFLARHGTQHSYLPSEVNYRANIFALKKLGARRVVGISAAGSLRMEIKPGELALAAQYFDYTRGKRAYEYADALLTCLGKRPHSLSDISRKRIR